MSPNPKGAATLAAPAHMEEGQREETHYMTIEILGAGGSACAAESVGG